jgi:hypothetical protein
MQEETNSLLHQRRHNGRSNKSLFTLKLLPKHTKEITKCQALHVYVVVENVKNAGRVCVCVMSLAALPVRCPVSSRGLIESLWDTHEADTTWQRRWQLFTSPLTSVGLQHSKWLETPPSSLWHWTLSASHVLTLRHSRIPVLPPLSSSC